ncbi:MAG: ribosome recycling factor [Thermoguttaceae bacterium]|nr:ribosome recycling factor [Thermoguttaceae bacterium]MBR5415431.1 ribosome recycling factor [Thermoguttaceae bacterium]MBR6480447.1 ribosome recycling factor [Thermoguttaceae bacterium]MCR5359363.1 ribosome recycling factor [Thermoguttaceae bacterium]
MTTDEILFDVEDRMEKSIARLKRELAGIRTGRANPGLVDSVKVIAYGVEVPLKQVATVACPEPTQILIRPFDASTLKDIEKGIMNSELGYAPNNDGKVIRLNIPPLSREVRQKMVTTIRKMAEETKVAIRNVRRDGNKMVESEEKSKTISEDQRDKAKNDIQDLTKKYEDTASDLARAREEEVMED